MKHQFADECENPITCKTCKGKGIISHHIEEFTEPTHSQCCPMCLGYKIELSPEEYDRIITERAKIRAHSK